jgi:hypothetical protein
MFVNNYLFCDICKTLIFFIQFFVNVRRNGKCLILFLELLRRQEDLRRIDELRSHEIDRRRNMIPMHRPPDAYNHPFNMSNVSGNNIFHQNQAAANVLQYNDFQQVGYPNQQASPVAASIDAAYTTNQVARGYGLGNTRTGGDDFIQQQQQQQQHGFDRKRPRY